MVQWAILLLTCINASESVAKVPYNIRTDWHPEYKCWYDSDGLLKEYYHFTYDGDGNILTEAAYDVYDGYVYNRYDKTYEYYHDLESNADVKKVVSETPAKKSAEEFYYDAKKRLFKTISYNLYGDAPYMRTSLVQTNIFYDEVLSDLETKVEEIKYGEHSILKETLITRNEDGNIVNVKYYKYPQMLLKEIIVTYDEDKKPDTVSLYNADGKLTKETSDIEWLKTDGQIVDYKDIYDPKVDNVDILHQNNLIISATERQYQRPDYVEFKETKYKVDYDIEGWAPGSFDIFEKHEHYADFTSVRVIDDFGSIFKIIAYDHYYQWDQFGLQLEYGYVWDYDGYRKSSRVEYDKVTGFPIAYYTSVTENIYHPNGHGVYYEVVTTCWKYTEPDFSAVKSIEDTDDSFNLPKEYYNLNGLKVDEKNLQPGIYIMRQGKHTQKVKI